MDDGGSPQNRGRFTVSRASLLRRFRDASGATAIEYALIGSLISMVIVVGLNGTSVQMQQVFGEVGAALGSPSCGGGGKMPLGIKGC